MAQYIVSRLVEYNAGTRVSNHRRIAEILTVIRSAKRVKHHIPIDPAYRPVIQITQDINSILFSAEPIVHCDTGTIARLCWQQELVWEHLVHLIQTLKIFKHPIPMEANALNIPESAAA